MSEVSIIIRTKNEEKWIKHCLTMIFAQSYKDFEVIIVDNLSDDNTLNIVKRFPVKKIISIDDFKPGKAINDGVGVSTGKFIVCLSAHCIPKNKDWLQILIQNFVKNTKLAGVYGRQLPVSFTGDVDKRDLLIVFGKDKRVQKKDYFFHNANSMIRKDIWEKYKFDENVSNIEDRVWGKKIIESGYQIIYEPDAPVYHHHGLHQGNATLRAKGVVSVIEKVDNDALYELPNSMKPENVNVAAIIPITSKILNDKRKLKLFKKTCQNVNKSKFIKNIYVVSYEKLKMPNNFIWIDRKKIKNIDNLDVDKMMQSILFYIEKLSDFPDSLIYVNHEYVERPAILFDNIISDAQFNGYDTVFPGFVDYNQYWFQNEDGDFKQTDTSTKSRKERLPTYRALYGLGCFTNSSVVRKGNLVGGKIGIFPITDYSVIHRLKDNDKQI